MLLVLVPAGACAVLWCWCWFWCWLVLVLLVRLVLGRRRRARPCRHSAGGVSPRATPSRRPRRFVNVTASHVQFNSLFVAADCGASTSGLGQTGRGNGAGRRRQEEAVGGGARAWLIRRRVAAADVSATTTTTTSSSSSAAPFDQLTVRASVDVVDILSAAGSGWRVRRGAPEGGSVGRLELKCRAI